MAILGLKPSFLKAILRGPLRHFLFLNAQILGNKKQRRIFDITKTLHYFNQNVNQNVTQKMSLMKKQLFCFYFLVSLSPLTSLMGQKTVLQEWIADPKNGWVAEFSTDLRLDMLTESETSTLYKETKIYLEGGLDIVKLLENDKSGYDEGYHRLSYLLMAGVESGQIIAYESPFSDQKAPSSNWIRQDTITRINPTTYETVQVVISNQVNPEDIKIFRAHQIVAYQPATATWKVKVIAVAPLIIRRDEAGTFMYIEPLFWIKVTDKKVKLNSPDITWAVRTRARQREGVLDFKKLILEAKKSQADLPMAHFLDKISKDERVPLDGVASWKEPKLTTLERKNVLSRTDTIQTIDPVTYESRLKIVISKTEAADLEKVRIVQEWAWDNRRKTMSVRLHSIAPIKDVTNEAGDFLYSAPIFYRRND